jgi:hypothetical protein
MANSEEGIGEMVCEALNKWFFELGREEYEEVDAGEGEVIIREVDSGKKFKVAYTVTEI